MQSIISDYVRQHDRDHFICSLFISQSVRRNYLALYAFNIEINNIIYDCSEAMAALVRLKWWREKISMIYHDKVVNRPLSKPVCGEKFLGKEQCRILVEECRQTATTKLPSEIKFQKRFNDNQVLSELANVIHFTVIPEFLINDYLDGYEQMVYQTSHKSASDLEKIAAQTTVNLIKMLFTTAIKNYSNDQLAYHCGVAWHLMNSLRNVAIEQPDKETIVSIVERAEYHINQVKNLIKTAPKKIVKITLQVKLASLYLNRIRNRKFNVISKKIAIISPIMQIKMLFHYLIIQ